VTETRPLAGRRVLITRAEKQAKAFADALVALGVEPLFLPGLEIAPPESFAPLEQALARFEQFDWVVLTSQNGVQAFVLHAKHAGQDLSRPHYAAVGPKTARALTAEGLASELVAPEAVAESLAEVLAPRVRGKRVLLPRAQEARELLPEMLRQAGAVEVCVVPVYRVVSAPSMALASITGRLARGEIDAVTFASARTVQEVVAKVQAALGARALEQLNRCRIFSIGPITTRACRSIGIPNVVEANPHTIEGMIEAMVGALGGR
jgi:uroporphyrinogen-III synthase